MQDMLVKLYDLDDRRVLDAIAEQQERGITIRRAMAYEKHLVTEWVRREFSDGWASECDTSFGNRPIACFIAVEDGKMIGFASYDATWKNAFGPTGVMERARGRGTGQALLLACLQSMKAQGFAYAIIAGVGPAQFYRKSVGAELIPGSTPGYYPPFLDDSV